ncbi:restriction endonuclease [Candidatus Babeliales bacterium]|nr:restriction endonuclease [Candidatus Babeliales bacterium]
MEKTVYITKASGEREPFSQEKYCQSLQRAGADPELIQKVCADVKPLMHEGMTTHELYQLTHQLLGKKQQRAVAGRYHFRQAIMALGPSGFPFEHYVAELLKRQGYQVVVGQVVMGKCVSHEVDIIAIKDHDRFIMECKFHHAVGARCSIQTALYVKARYEDILARNHNNDFSGTWLVTNAKISTVAIQYGLCVGMKLLAWDYPQNNGLERIVDQLGLHPITCLSSLPKSAIEELLREGIVLCLDVHNHKDLLRRLHLSDERVSDILRECDEISRTQK